jgi:GTP1/Obg family GTP-binding protein
MIYNFKSIVMVPTGKEFIDVILSKTQRKTPTVVHAGYKISRIRAFYMRKVKFTQQNIHDKISQILEDFPRLDVRRYRAVLSLVSLGLISRVFPRSLCAGHSPVLR